MERATGFFGDVGRDGAEASLAKDDCVAGVGGATGDEASGNHMGRLEVLATGGAEEGTNGVKSVNEARDAELFVGNT